MSALILIWVKNSIVILERHLVWLNFLQLASHTYNNLILTFFCTKGYEKKPLQKKLRKHTHPLASGMVDKCILLYYFLVYLQHRFFWRASEKTLAYKKYPFAWPLHCHNCISSKDVSTLPNAPPFKLYLEHAMRKKGRKSSAQRVKHICFISLNLLIIKICQGIHFLI